MNASNNKKGCGDRFARAHRVGGSADYAGRGNWADEVAS